MGFKVELKGFPGVGYYTIRLENGLTVCYLGDPKNQKIELVCENSFEAKEFCTKKLKEKLKGLLKKNKYADDKPLNKI